MYALVYRGQVVQVEKEPFPVHPDLQWVDLKEHEVIPEYGWFYTDGKFVPPPEPQVPELAEVAEEKLRDELLVKVADYLIGQASQDEVKSALMRYKEAKVKCYD